MTRYRMESSVVDTRRATAQVEVGSHAAQYGKETETLYRSRRGRWYLEHTFNWCEDNRQLDYAEWLSPQEAAKRLSEAGHDDYTNWPEIAEVIDQVTE